MQVFDNEKMNTLSERLIEARNDKGWKKADLKRAAGLKSPSTLTELENGLRTESPQLIAIAAALGVSPMWLQHGKGSKYAGAKQAVPVLDPKASKRQRRIDDLIAIASQIDDDGLIELTGMAKVLAGKQPAVKESAA